jgi:uncharacterized protein (DUF488 family)
VATVGYEGTTVAAFLDALRAADVALLVDVRAVASSRRPGFAKSRLAANLAGAGSTTCTCAASARRPTGAPRRAPGAMPRCRPSSGRHLATDAAQADLDALAALVDDGRRVCLLCFEADPAHCHRLLVAEALAARRPVRVTHLAPQRAAAD